jgi:hypothetical protein
MGSRRTVTAAHQPELVAAAQAAVTAGMAAAAEYHQAAGARPGVGVPVALPSAGGPLGPVIGLNFDLPPDVPAIRPAPRPASPAPAAVDPVIGGAAHVGSGGLLGQSPSLRSDPIRYIPLSSSPVSAPRPSLGDRLRSALRALWRR